MEGLIPQGFPAPDRAVQAGVPVGRASIKNGFFRSISRTPARCRQAWVEVVDFLVNLSQKSTASFVFSRHEES
ncbi:hypothetical protein MNBD_BACTEROID03-836 [hydrothermal vent metagenome]|uniref:Uncharacterized protein n=1 Tax=hydrothermal vent metagenome TaxID=652676 RepID=A0A3B0TGR3_9ZZZZ